MNSNRLSTSKVGNNNRDSLEKANVEERILNLLSSPSNYELHANGKIYIKSLGCYLKGRGNIGVLALDEKGKLMFNFNSINDCALFFNVHSRTIVRRLDKGTMFEHNGKNLMLKREVYLP